VIATSSSKQKAERLRDLGADEVVDYSQNPAWYDEVRQLTGARGADHVIDVAGVLDQSVRATALGGEVTLVGISQGLDAAAEPLSAATVFGGGVTVRPIAVGSRAQFTAMNRAVTHAGLRPVIDRVFGFDEVPAALAYYRRGAFFGKVVISHHS
jgi:NADPH:quinone reductase-like Zn-dependent oxidoreductase